ncbi:MAG: AMP-binding protein [Myxococcales bacterium]|nr:AMP-binding protein [Myxococcales bacterium]MCB9713007.1 AMP-binding protein [Myxococcales bacterium]
MSTAAFERLAQGLRQRPEHPLLITEHQVVTADELWRRSRAWAERLRGWGLTRGDRVAVLAGAHPEAVALMLGILRAGLVHVPINPRYRGAELRHVLVDCGAARLLCDRELADERLETLPSALPWHAIEAPPAPAKHDAPSPDAPVRDDETALLVYTSGTTGRSKGVRLSPRAIVDAIGALTELWRFDPHDVLSLALPLFHVHGLCIGIYGALIHGMTVRLHERFEPAAVVDDLAHGATVFMGVPTMYGRLLEHLQAHPEAAAVLARARLFTAGSAALRPAVLERFEQLTGHRILERYGMSETLITLSNPYEGERRAGAVGRPVPGFEARVVDDAGHEVDSGELGELWVRGPGLMQGYWGRPEETAAAFTDGWFRTGDMVRADPDGMLRIVGRRSVDIIKSGGFKVSALEIEEVLRDHPQVEDAAVVGVPDARWGERIGAAVVPRPGTAPSADALTRWVAERLADYKKPRQVELMAELPRNALGKVQKPPIVAALRRPDDPER